MQVMLHSWEEEKSSAYLYRVMAESEPHAGHRVLFAQLAKEAEIQAELWAEKLRAIGAQVPSHYTGSARTRLAAHLIRWLGPRRLCPMLAAMKVRGLSVYRGSITDGHAMPTCAEDVGHRHRGVDSGGNLRAAVFGVNDGLVSNTSLVLGIAGAAQEPRVILLSGIAGLLAGAFSMAAGEYVSMRSQREMYECQIALEREELGLYPEQEAEELALIYHARGMPLEEARIMTRKLVEEPERALDTLSREELGLNPRELGSPWGAAVSSFAAFSAGALLPLLPFLMGAGAEAVPVSAATAVVGLFAVGAALSLFTGRRALWSGLRMVLIGGAAGLATYAIGELLGRSLT